MRMIVAIALVPFVANAQATPRPKSARPSTARTTQSAGTRVATVTTGAIDPGMTRAQVIGVFGPPIAQRAVGNQTYLFYHNGCERRCGMYDLVMLDGDSVADAVLRAPGRRYTGTSSSPVGTRSVPTNVVSVPADEAGAPVAGSPAPGSTTVLPSVRSRVDANAAGNQSAPAATIGQPAGAASVPAAQAGGRPPARPDSVTPRTVHKGDPMPPQPPRTIFPTKPKP